MIGCYTPCHIQGIAHMSDVELRDALDRLSGLRFCGIWQTDHGDFALFEDALGTRSSFMLKTGETLGEGIERVTARYREANSDITSSISL